VPLGELLATLERDADVEVRATTAAAKDEAARIEAEAGRQCAERLAQAMREITVRERAKSESRLAEATRHHRREILEARAAMLARLRVTVRAILPSLVDDATRARFAAAATAFGEGMRRDVPTGVIIERADGTSIEASLDAALESAWPRLAAEALAAVEGGRT
jgi:vacuolar-type H+-ATPase subunit E/Vma4